MTTPNQGLLERLFKLSEHGTTVRTEILAGVTTFLTMCYIVIVNPGILSLTGMDFGAVFVATCVSAAIGCFIMGAFANYPIALAPGMGLNAYFTFAVVKGMGVPWQVALAAVFMYLMAQAYSRAEAQQLAPIHYTELIYASAIGFFIFHETPRFLEDGVFHFFDNRNARLCSSAVTVE